MAELVEKAAGGILKEELLSLEKWISEEQGKLSEDIEKLQVIL